MEVFVNLFCSVSGARNGSESGQSSVSFCLLIRPVSCSQSVIHDLVTRVSSPPFFTFLGLSSYLPLLVTLILGHFSEKCSSWPLSLYLQASVFHYFFSSLLFLDVFAVILVLLRIVFHTPERLRSVIIEARHFEVSVKFSGCKWCMII